jgi:hypothetical protein
MSKPITSTQCRATVKQGKNALRRCMQCGCYINVLFGKDEPAAHQDAEGTRDEMCDVCDYA